MTERFDFMSATGSIELDESIPIYSPQRRKIAYRTADMYEPFYPIVQFNGPSGKLNAPEYAFASSENPSDKALNICKVIQRSETDSWTECSPINPCRSAILPVT